MRNIVTLVPISPISERTKGNILFVVVPRFESIIFQETFSTFQKIYIIAIMMTLPIIPAIRLPRELRRSS